MSMRKRMIIAVVSLLLLLAACSSPSGKFTKEIEKISKLMNKMEYEEALTSLTNLEENVVPGDTYEAGRMKIVDELINEAEYMIDHIEDLKEDYEVAMAIYETTKEDADDDVEQYKEAYQSLDE